MRDLSVNSWISWRSMKWRLPWHGKGFIFMAMRFHPPTGGAAAAFPKCRKGLWQGERPTNAWWDENGGFVVSLVQGTVLVWVESQQDWMNISADSADASVHYQGLLGFFSDFRFFSSISPSKFSQHFPDIFQNNYPWFSRFSQHLPRFYRFSCTFVLDFPTIFLQGGAPPTINGL